MEDREHKNLIYTDLTNQMENHMADYYRLGNQTLDVEKTFGMLYDSFTSLTDNLRSISRTTGFQAVIYDEQENF